MTPEERKALAEQLLGNPLLKEILNGIEAGAINALIYADTEQARVEAQWRVRAARSFLDDCEAALYSTHLRKGAGA